MKRLLWSLLVCGSCWYSTNAHACAFINNRCVASVGEAKWIEVPQVALDYLRSRGVTVTGGLGTEPLRMKLGEKTFEIRPPDAKVAHIWLLEGDDPREKAVVFVLESHTGVRQVCEISSYDTPHLWHECHLMSPQQKRR